MIGAVVAVAQPIISHISLKPSSESRANKVVGGVIQSALNGNLTAVKCLDERRTTPLFTQRFGVASENAVWEKGYQQVVTTKPELLAQYRNNRTKIPPINHASPETAAASALANPFSASGVQTPTPVVSNDPALSAVTSALPSAGGMPLWLLLVLAGGIGFAVYKATRGR